MVNWKFNLKKEVEGEAETSGVRILRILCEDAVHIMTEHKFVLNIQEVSVGKHLYSQVVQGQRMHPVSLKHH